MRTAWGSVHYDRCVLSSSGGIEAHSSGGG